MSFFSLSTKDCRSLLSTFVDWKCTPDKKQVCNEIIMNWNTIKEKLLFNSNDEISVKFRFFHKEEVKMKDGSIKKCLKAHCESVNMTHLVNFFSGMLQRIIHHRNQ